MRTLQHTTTNDILGCHGWQRGVVVIVGLINEVNQRWARLVLGWVTVFGRVNNGRKKYLHI